MVKSKERIAAKVNRALKKCGLPEVAKPLPIRYERLTKGHIGRASCDGDWQIVLIDESQYDPWRPKAAEDTYAHELIHHALADAARLDPSINEIHHHGKTFKRVAFAAGLRTWGDKTWRWKWECSKCSYWVKTHARKLASRTCRHCKPEREVKTQTINGIRYLVMIERRVLLKPKKIFEIIIEKKETVNERATAS